MNHILSRRNFALALLLTAGIGVSQGATDLWDGTLSRPQDIGYGTADNPILINTAEEFAFLMSRYENTNGYIANAYYRLTCDLDMAGLPWSYGVQTHDNKSWRAHFDGAGHCISNVYIPVISSGLAADCGLFARLGGDPNHVGVIENLEVQNITVERMNFSGRSSGQKEQGMLVGNDYGYSNILNCKVDGSSFYPTRVRIDDSQGTMGIFKAVVTSGRTPASFRWHLEGMPLDETSAQCHLQPDIITRNLSVEALDPRGNVIGSGAVSIPAVPLELIITNVTTAGSNNYNITAAVSGPGADVLTDDFLFSWYEIEEGKEHTSTVGTSRTLTGARGNRTYHVVARHKRYKNCILGTYHTFRQPVYVSLHGIGEADTRRYTIDGTVYPEGNDKNDGATPETAVRTLRRAYQLIKPAAEGADAWSNIIVIIGDYDQDVFNTHLDSYQQQPNPDWFLKDKPATIVGQYGNIHGGRIQLSGETLVLDADTRFDAIDIHGNPAVEGGDVAQLYAQCNDLWMGDGVTVSDYASMGDARGIIQGCNAPHFSIFGAYFNNDDPNLRLRPNRMVFYSGYWGRIVAGGRHNRLNTHTGNVVGSPRFPMRSYIRIETANNTNPNGYTYDVALLVGGQSDGSIYAADTIDILQPTRIGRVIGGNIGFGRTSYIEADGKRIERPADSFFGQIIVNISGGSIEELYGTSLGRNGNLLHPDEPDVVDTCVTYFYGRSFIELKGGTVNTGLYGAGAGGVTGLGDDRHHTFDPLIPYTLRNGNVEYGPYDKARGRLPQVIMVDGQSLALDSSEVHIDIDGTTLMRGCVYGGGYGYSNQLHTRHASSQSGSIFGNTYISVGGQAHVNGYVFGGGRGTNIYYDNLDGMGYPRLNGVEADRSYVSSLANVYGRTWVNLTGGIVYGCVFGGGEGTDYRAASPDDSTNVTAHMAAVYGSASVYVSGTAVTRDFIFGGANYGNICKHGSLDPYEDGSTHVYIEGGYLQNSVFGGGHGHLSRRPGERLVSSDVEGDTYVFLRGGEFQYVNTGSRYDSVRYYGVYGAGHTASVVKGSAHVVARRSLFSGDFLRKAGFTHWEFGKLWRPFYALCGGGYGARADVLGDTFVEIDVDDAPAFADSIFFNKGETPGTYPTVPFYSFIDVLGGGLSGNVYGSTNVSVRGRAYMRNIYGGGLVGSVGLRDDALNGDHDRPDDAERAYTTHAQIDFKSGSAFNIYGGSFMGQVCGETFVNIGTPADSASNVDCHIYNVFGGNDVTGVIAGGNNDRYGTNINIMGGTIHGDVYGAGNGAFGDEEKPTPRKPANAPQNRILNRQRPHVASAKIRIAGSSPTDKARIKGALFGGGNNTTVGIFVPDTATTPHWGLKREVIVPNRGSIHVNLGSHVEIRDLFMGSNGRALKDYIPYYTEDGGEHWWKGFLSEEAFLNFCRSVDVACMPVLTFNADGGFHNDYPIVDWFGDRKHFETPGEMDAVDVTVTNFFGGSYSGSMISDSVCIYTLPPGLTVRHSIVGGCSNSYIRYHENHGPDAGKHRLRIGGFVPYHEDTEEYHRLQLNIFCKFDPIRPARTASGVRTFEGAVVFGGCYDHGVINGATSINFHSNLVGDYDIINASEDLYRAANYLNSDCAQIYGGGKGKETEIIGSTFVTMSGALFNGVKCIPNLFNAFGGGMMGRIVGRTRVTYDGECPDASPLDATHYMLWGKMYGGGRMGDIVSRSRELPHMTSPTGAGARVYVYSGMVNQVFGGGRMGDIEGGTYVEINDKSHNHFHTLVRRVFGGSDISGTIGVGQHKPDGARRNTRSNTFVRIMETLKEDSTYTGFPLIGEVYAGSNGQYGTGGYDRYDGGYIHSRNNDSIALAGINRPNVDSVYVEVLGGTISDLYGGANESLVRKNAVISLRYNKDNADVRSHFDCAVSQDCYRRGKWIVKQFRTFVDGYTDDGTVIRMDNNIRHLFGGNKRTNMIIQPKWRLRCGNVGTIYGGCNNGDVIYYNEEADRNVHVGADSTFYQGGRETFYTPGIVLDLPWPDLRADNVFGGSRMGTVQACRILRDADGYIQRTEPVTFADNQYGVMVRITNGRFKRVFGGNDITGTINNGTHIQITGGVIDEVFGAGNGEYEYEYTDEVSEVTELWDSDRKVWYYRLPAVPQFGGAYATDFQKIEAINWYRPNIAKSSIEVAGGIRSDMTRRMAYILGGIYCGGNCSTIAGPDNTEGQVRLDIGGQLVANNVYLGSNGAPHIAPLYIQRLMQRNHIGNIAQQDTEGRTLLDYHMDAVMMHGLPKDFQFHRNYTNCYIGSFYMGGNRGSLATHGSLDITFPRSMTIFDKIVGGSNRAEIVYRDPDTGETLIHHGGILYDGVGERPRIHLTVESQYSNLTLKADPALAAQHYLVHPAEPDYGSVPVYSGCYQSGKVEGEVTAEINEADDDTIEPGIITTDQPSTGGGFFE